VERTCGAFEHRKKYGPELPQLPKDYGQMMITDLNSMHRRLKVISSR
jgi:hypothetical protein